MIVKALRSGAHELKFVGLMHYSPSSCPIHTTNPALRGSQERMNPAWRGSCTPSVTYSREVASLCIKQLQLRYPWYRGRVVERVTLEITRWRMGWCVMNFLYCLGKYTIICLFSLWKYFCTALAVWQFVTWKFFLSLIFSYGTASYKIKVVRSIVKRTFWERKG